MGSSLGAYPGAQSAFTSRGSAADARHSSFSRHQDHVVMPRESDKGWRKDGICLDKERIAAESKTCRILDC